MAIMIPQHPVGSTDTAEEFYQNLHHQLGPEYKINQYLGSAHSLKGALLWVQYKSQSLFIYVSDLSEKQLGTDATKKSDKKTLQEHILKSFEIKRIVAYQRHLISEELHAFQAQLAPFIIIHSQIPEGKLNIQLKSQGITLLGKEVLESSNLKKLLHKFIGHQYSQKSQKHTQIAFSPETKVIYNDESFLLDQEQEKAVKADIELNNEEIQSHNYNLCGVNGGSSSGKSEVILQRANLLSRLNSSQRILVLTTDDTSKENLSQRFKESPSAVHAKNIQLLSFHQWCEQQLQPEQKLIHDDAIKDAIIDLVRQRLSNSNISLLVFLREMNFIQGKIVKNEEAYLKTRNSSQLSKVQHKDIWRTLQKINDNLVQKNFSLYSNLPRLLWEASQRGKSLEKYDHILIDDAHYFSSLAFELIKKALKSKTGQLFISQDPRQGIVNPISLWKDTGLDLRGKSSRLLNCYQTNPTILNAANAFYMSRLPDDTDKVIQFNFTRDKNLKKPQLLHFNNARDEENRLLNEIKTLIQDDTKVKDILLIAFDEKSCSHLSELLKQTLEISTTLINQPSQEQGLRICTLEQSQNLNSPYVFIFGLEELFEKDNEFAEKITHINTDNYHQALYVENTRKLNMAMITAKKELTLFISADEIPNELLSPHIETPTTDNSSLAEVHQLKA